MNKEVRRIINPNEVRFVWRLISDAQVQGMNTSLDHFLSISQSTAFYTSEDLKKLFNNSIESGLVSVCEDGTLMISVPDDERDPDHDWYCFECHLAGEIICCSRCQRVFHLNCYKPIVDSSNCIICKYCQMSVMPTNLDQNQLSERLKGILNWAHKNGPSLTTLPNTVSSADGITIIRNQYRLLIAKHMDLATMKSYAQTHKYTNTQQFLNDFKLLVHNTIVMYGSTSECATHADELLKQAIAELEDLERQANQNSDAAGSSSLSLNKKEKSRKRGDSSFSSSGSDLQNKRRRRDANKDSPSMKKASKKVAESEDIPIVSSSSETDSLTSKAVQTEPTLSEVVCNCEGKFNEMLERLQNDWNEQYLFDKKRTMIKLAEKLDADNKSEQETKEERMKEEIAAKYREDLEITRDQIEKQCQAKLNRLSMEHAKKISEAKKRQWCYVCENEAIYHCCWNTAYCSVECQQKQWPQHRRTCRRKKLQS